MSALTKLLEDQLQAAKLQAGTKIVRKLKNGLRIEMTHIHSNVMLCLTRDHTYPSIQEWETVLRHFLYRVPNAAPHQLQQGARYTIYQELPSQRAAQSQLL